MTQQAFVSGDVCFRAGDGVMMPIPDGPVEVDLTDESATLSWTASNGAAGATAITRDEYDRYVKDGMIRTGAGQR